MGNVVRIRLGAGDEALLPQRRHHRAAGRVDLHAAKGLGGVVGHAPVLADHGDLGQAVSAPDLEVGGVVPGGDLERTGAELGVHVLVGDDRQPATDQRQDGRLSDQPGVAVVARVHGNGGVREHRLWAHGGNGDRAGP